MSEQWNRLCLPQEPEQRTFELFHENSKTSRYEAPFQISEVLKHMAELWESLPYANAPKVELPQDFAALEKPLDEVLRARASGRQLEPVDLSLTQLATILHRMYGVTRSNEGTVFPRPFRSVPSGGGLYPLEIYFYTSRVAGLRPGIYHYNAAEHRLALLRQEDLSHELSAALVQSNLVLDTSVLFFVTAVFERSVFKYGERGYRFALIEAGHVGQNLSLVAEGLGLRGLSIGGYFDRSVDALLGLDGIAHSTVYMLGLGHEVEEEKTI